MVWIKFNDQIPEIYLVLNKYRESHNLYPLKHQTALVVCCLQVYLYPEHYTKTYWLYACRYSKNTGSNVRINGVLGRKDQSLFINKSDFYRHLLWLKTRTSSTESAYHRRWNCFFNLWCIPMVLLMVTQ